MDFKTVKLGGKEYPIIFSAWVIDQIQEKSDDVEAELSRILDSSKVKDMLWLLSLFLRGGYEGAKILGKETPEPPTFEQLMFLTSVTDFASIGKAIREAVGTGEPDVKLEDEKNLKATTPEA